MVFLLTINLHITNNLFVPFTIFFYKKYILYQPLQIPYIFSDKIFFTIIITTINLFNI